MSRRTSAPQSLSVNPLAAALLSATLLGRLRHQSHRRRSAMTPTCRRCRPFRRRSPTSAPAAACSARLDPGRGGTAAATPTAASRMPMPPPASSRAARATTTPSRFIRGRKARSIRSMPRPGRSRHCAGARRKPDRRRPDRRRRHRPLDHRRHRERHRATPPCPCAGEADAPRHHHQPRHHHRPAHLHARAARRRTTLHAGRGLGLSAAARFAAPDRSGHARHPGRTPRATIATG